MTKTLPRNLGRNGPIINALGLGCMGMSAFYGTTSVTEESALATLNRAIDLGVTFWDTADVYGDNEILLSKILTQRRNEVFLATKFGIAVVDGKRAICGKPEYVRQALDKSLKRLGVEYVDLYYMHRMDPNTPIEETMQTLSSLVKENKIKHIGLSECSAETLRRAHAIHPVSAVQVEYSPWTLDIEQNGLLTACRELGVAIVAYSPLGRGFLTGRFQSPSDFEEGDWRKYNPRFQGENFAKNLVLVEKFKELAAKKGCKPSQLVLAWVLHQGEEFFTISGTTKIQNLEENVGALDVVITEEDDREVRRIVESIGVAGTRYDSDGMRTLNL